MGEGMLDLYGGYLLASAGRAAAAGLSELAGGAISRDRDSRLLAGEELNGKLLRLKRKKLTRQYESDEGCLIFDDTIVEKAYMDWHYSRGEGGNVKGMNILAGVYVAGNEREKPRAPIKTGERAAGKRGERE
jgi:hypothetical protein